MNDFSDKGMIYVAVCRARDLVPDVSYESVCCEEAYAAGYKDAVERVLEELGDAEVL